jgi:hypothetical protein
MVLRSLAFVSGVVELFAPRRVVDWWVSLAVESDAAVSAQVWVYTAARIEGLLLVVWALRGCRSDGSV